ncbi:1-phosphofructokinase family hexose kinase [Phytoactinopolyspora alkaliphila]|uniref:1-phosphofructokinase family hexose kinase n=1 Tax=Phytoactinopolyspora alkaliphila TaxID=1783498 RepID=A0A6N9YL44_9ACTN|nr:1-phosphofructokinase family hexose kinase [Phytoactinopolyspora alkaliphila]NED95675.1 1-phosphofructokinase family hexose kinase [Phytoactinopolyspora alkaliphila]
MSVVTVTPNPALDLTYTVERLEPGTVHRIGTVHSRPGGKGLNVARVLHALDVPVTVTGLVGGAEGTALRAGVGELGIADAFVAADIQTRRTVNIVDQSSGDATLFNEPGPRVSADQWAVLADRVSALATAGEVVVVSGSLPPGVDPDMLGDLVRAISAAGAPAVVDVSGDVLPAVVSAAPYVVKPNAEELRAATGIGDPRSAARALTEAGGCVVVASLGPDGLLAVTGDASWTARLAKPLTGNPTGAGDSVVAALSAGILAGRSWPDMLRDACALSAATVRAPVAGEYDADAYARLKPAVEIHEVTL